MGGRKGRGLGSRVTIEMNTGAPLLSTFANSWTRWHSRTRSRSCDSSGSGHVGVGGRKVRKNSGTVVLSRFVDLY